MSNIIKSLTFLILVVYTVTFRLASLQQDVQDDLWQTDSSYDTSALTTTKRNKCDAEDNDDDQDIDLVFVNEDPKLNFAATDGIQKLSKTFSYVCFKILNQPLINPYRGTLFDKMESPFNIPSFTLLPLRSPPYFLI